MGLEIDTNNLIIQAKSEQKAATKISNDNPISIFSFDNLKEHKTELTIAGGIAIVGLMGLSLLTRKKIPMTSTKPFSFFDSHKIRLELLDFLEKDFLKQNKLDVKPDIFFDLPKTKFAINGVGQISPYNNIIMVKRELFTKNYYKIVDMTTKKCSVEAKINWQRTGTFKQLQSIIENEKLDNVIIVPLTRAERMKIAKATVAHEAFHSMQYANMIMHPDIGLDRMINEMLKCETKMSQKTKEQLIKTAQKTWNNLIKSGKKIDPNSELGKRTKIQFEDLVNNVKRTNDSTLTYNDYVNSAYENEAYQKELEFAIKNNLLI